MVSRARTILRCAEGMRSRFKPSGAVLLDTQVSCGRNINALLSQISVKVAILYIGCMRLDEP